MEEQEKKTILLIDDDTSLLVTLSDFLKFEGYSVMTADSAERGLENLAGMTPDLIVLDMGMPGMGGQGFLKEISSPEGKPRYPVLVLTARASMAEFFANVDVDGFVAKPTDPQDLLMEVSRIIFLRRGTGSQDNRKCALEGKKVVIGEDDKAVNERLVGAFTAAGCVAEGVLGGPEILEKAVIERPDIVVMKVALGSMNGDAVAGILGKMPNTKDIPVVLYDDSGLRVPEPGYARPGTGVKKFVRNNDAMALLAAVREVLSGKD